MQTPEDGRRTHGAANAGPALRIAALADRQGAAMIDALLGGAHGFVVEALASTADLRARLAADDPDIALLVVDQTAAWPVTLAEDVAAAARDRVPLLVICAAVHDAELIERRIGGPGVTVLARSWLTADRLIDAARTAASRHRAGRSRATG